MSDHRLNKRQNEILDAMRAALGKGGRNRVVVESKLQWITEPESGGGGTGLPPVGGIVLIAAHLHAKTEPENEFSGCGIAMPTEVIATLLSEGAHFDRCPFTLRTSSQNNDTITCTCKDTLIRIETEQLQRSNS
jgi:hypothetical protein